MSFELGEMYDRPCAIVRMDDGREYAIPVFAHRHTDPQFGFPHEHYHIDGRFHLEPRMGHEYQLHRGHTAAVVQTESAAPQFLRLENRKVACVQPHTGLTFPGSPTERQIENLEKYASWYASYLGKVCEGKRCPHFGTEMLEKDGRLVCPMHELTADLETLRIIAR